MNVVKTIYEQLYHSEPKARVEIASWGAHAWQSVEAGQGLQFKVDGHHFKGHIRIIYDYGSDTYTLHFGNYYANTWRDSEECQPNVFFDELLDRLDKRIEYIENYKF